MPSAQEVLHRQWLMLQWIPRHPRRITARELVDRLEVEGYEVTKRTVERDLAALSGVFPLTVDDRTRPFGWSWQRDAASFSLPGMSPLQAMVLQLARGHLEPLLPAHLLGRLEPYFAQAGNTLKQVGHPGSVGQWAEKVAAIPATQALLPPEMDEDVLMTVHQALHLGLQLEAEYLQKGAAAPKPYRVHPLGLVQRGAVTYLVCTLFDYDDVRSLALHRMTSATLGDEPARSPTGFSLQAHLANGAFDFVDRGPIDLQLRMEAPAAEHLRETRLSTDQRIEPDAEVGWVCISATVRDTSQLRWWLLAFGDQVVVLAPPHLRDFLRSTASGSFRHYHSQPEEGVGND